MSDPAQDREIERRRYNARAARRSPEADLGPAGAESVPVPLRLPYLNYEDLIRTTVRAGDQVLDLCGGDGLHSLTAARVGAIVTVSDIAEQSLELARRRAEAAGLTVQTQVGDAANLPLPDAFFDVITCAGGLSYIDPADWRRELHRLLRPGGTFIFVDSLNHNPAYRLNRYLHYLRGHRSRSTLERMPTLTMLDDLRADLPDLRLSFHGVFAFLLPLLGWMSPDRAAAWLDARDRAWPSLGRFAFKVVGIGHRPGA